MSARRLVVRLARVLVLALVAILGGACRDAVAPAGDAPAFRRLVPCGGTARLQRPDSAVWETLDTSLVIPGALQLGAPDAGDARLCFADGSIVELAPGTTIDVRPSADGAGLVIWLEQGDALLLAREASYELNTPACAVIVEEVPARLRAEREEETTRVLVEQGSAVCRQGSETIFLATCWQVVATRGEEAAIMQYCGDVVGPSETETPSPAEPSPTAAPPTEPAAATPTPPQPTEEAPTATPEPSPIP